MAEKKKGKRRKEEYVAPGEDVVPKPSKEEYAVAKWMRKNAPIKKTKFLNHNVQYFTASKAVDALLESHWSTGSEPFFKTRESIVDFLHIMLEHKFYHRARKVPVSEQELKAKKKDKKSIEPAGDKKTTKKNETEKEKSEKATDAESSVAEVKKEEGSGDKEKRKRKIRLDMHNDQRFVDGLDAYVWIYDPIPFYYWIIGTLLVLGAIGVCLFPLWPPTVRLGVYYLSVAAAGFLVFILVLAILRVIVFCLVWFVTFGKHHLWILPNLTEDVGFFASFWPLYTYEYKGKAGNNKTKKKDKDSDAEDEDSKEENVEKEDSIESKDDVLTDDKQKESDSNLENGSQAEEVLGASESESESSQRSSTGKDFEMVDQVDLES